MRGLIIRANYFYSKDVRKSTWPDDIDKYRNFDKSGEEFRNIINVWTCVEKGDKEQYLKSLVKRIKELNEQFYKLNHIVILPFAHLSNKLAHPKKVRELLSKLLVLLRKEQFEVDIISFGTHKDLKLEIPAQPAEVSYFEFPYCGKKPKTK